MVFGVKTANMTFFSAYWKHGS